MAVEEFKELLYLHPQENWAEVYRENPNSLSTLVNSGCKAIISSISHCITETSAAISEESVPFPELYTHLAEVLDSVYYQRVLRKEENEDFNEQEKSNSNFFKGEGELSREDGSTSRRRSECFKKCSTPNLCLHELLTKNSKPIACGRNYGTWDIAVKCFDCSLDTTSIMCVQCFGNSPCRNHRHEYQVSFGGGMCDCGDEYSWKKESFCTLHTHEVSEADYLSSLTPRDKKYVLELVTGYLRFITVRLLREMLSSSDSLFSFPVDLQQLVKNVSLLSRSGGDGAKHLIALAVSAPLIENFDFTIPVEWCERVDAPSFSTVDCIFDGLFLVYYCRQKKMCGLKEANSDEETEEDIGNYGEGKISSYWGLLGQVFENCMSDRVFRKIYGIVSLKYCYCPPSINYENMQVLANAAVVDHLSFPSNMLRVQIGDKWTTDNIVHRFLGSLLYNISFRSSEPISRGDEDDLPLIPLKFARIRAQMATTLSHFSSLLSCSRFAASSIVISRLALQAFCAFLQLFTTGTSFRATLEESANSMHAPEVCQYSWFYCVDITRVIVSELSRLFATRSKPKLMLEYIEKNQEWLSQLSKAVALDPILVPAPKRKDFSENFRSINVLNADEALLGFTHCKNCNEEIRDSGEDSASSMDRFEYTDGVTHLNAVLSGIWRSLVQTYRTLENHFFDSNNRETELHVLSANQIESSGKRCRCVGHPSASCQYDISKYGEKHTFFPCSLQEVFLANVLALLVGYEAQKSEKCAETMEGEFPKPFWRIGWRECCHEQQSAYEAGASSLFVHDVYRESKEIPFLSSCNRIDLDALLDSIAIKFVYAAQIKCNMWNGFSDAQDAVVVLQSGEQLIFLLQLLCAILSPEDFAIRLLQRFSFKSSMDDYTLGLPYFLLAVGSVLMGQFGPSFEGSSRKRRMRMILANYLCENGYSRKNLHGRAISIGGEFGEDVQQHEVVELVDEVLKDIGSQLPNSKIFRLKNLDSWDEVQPYSHMLWHRDLEKTFDEYTRLVRLHNFGLEEAKKKAELAGDPVPESPKRELRVPPAQFRCDIEVTTEPMWRAAGRDLLHSSVVLHVCLHQILDFYIKKVQPGKEVTSLKTKDTSTEPGLLHALELLYLCAKDAIFLSSTLMNQKRDKRGEPLVMADDESVNWPLVEEYLSAYVWNTSSYDSSFDVFLPVQLWSAPDTMVENSSPISLQQLIHFSVSMKPLFSAPEKAEPLNVGSVLRSVLSYFVSHEEQDRFSFRVMLEFVLRVTNSLPPLTDISKGNNEEETLKQKTKRRQMELLKRFRARKAMDNLNQEESPVSEVRNLESKEADTMENVSFMDVLLCKLSEKRCCACSMVSESEDVFLLASVSTSGVLSSLGYTLPDKRLSHNHVNTCGHVIHRGCMPMMFHYRFAGVTHKFCPLCRFECGAFLPIPLLKKQNKENGTQSEDSDSENLLSDSYWNLIQRWKEENGMASSVSSGVPSDPDFFTFRRALSSLISPMESSEEDSSGRRALQSLLASASTAFCEPADTTVSVEDDPLNQMNLEWWQISEAIRTIQYQLQLQVELIKVGGAVNQNFIFVLLSLVFSISSDILRENENVIRNRFENSGEAFLLLIMDVLLERSDNDYEWQSPIAVYTLDHVCCAPRLSSCLSAMLQRGSHPGSGASAITDVQVALWGSLCCLTLLQLVTSTARNVSTVLRVEWPSKAAAQQQTCFEDVVAMATLDFFTLHSKILDQSNDHLLCEAVMRMLYFLLPIDDSKARGSLVMEGEALNTEGGASPLSWLSRHAPALRTFLRDCWVSSLPMMVCSADEELYARNGLVPIVHPVTCSTAEAVEVALRCCSSDAGTSFHGPGIPEALVSLRAAEAKDQERAMAPSEWCYRILQNQLHFSKDYIDLIIDAYKKLPNGVVFSYGLPLQCRRCLEVFLGINSETHEAKKEMLELHLSKCTGSVGVGIFSFLHFNALVVYFAKKKDYVFVEAPYLTQYKEKASTTLNGVYTFDLAMGTETAKMFVQNNWISL